MREKTTVMAWEKRVMGRANKLAISIVVLVVVAWITVWLFEYSSQPLMIQGRLQEVRIIVVGPTGSTTFLPANAWKHSSKSPRTSSESPTNTSIMARVEEAVKHGRVYCELRILLDSDDTYHNVPAGRSNSYQLSIDYCRKVLDKLEPGSILVFYTEPGEPARIVKFVRITAPKE